MQERNKKLREQVRNLQKNKANEGNKSKGRRKNRKPKKKPLVYNANAHVIPKTVNDIGKFDNYVSCKDAYKYFISDNGRDTPVIDLIQIINSSGQQVDKFGKKHSIWTDILTVKCLRLIEYILHKLSSFDASSNPIKDINLKHDLNFNTSFVLLSYDNNFSIDIPELYLAALRLGASPLNSFIGDAQLNTYLATGRKIKKEKPAKKKKDENESDSDSDSEEEDEKEIDRMTQAYKNLIKKLSSNELFIARYDRFTAINENKFEELPPTYPLSNVKKEYKNQINNYRTGEEIDDDDDDETRNPALRSSYTARSLNSRFKRDTEIIRASDLKKIQKIVNTIAEDYELQTLPYDKTTAEDICSWISQFYYDFIRHNEEYYAITDANSNKSFIPHKDLIAFVNTSIPRQVKINAKSKFTDVPVGAKTYTYKEKDVYETDYKYTLLAFLARYRCSMFIEISKALAKNNVIFVNQDSVPLLKNTEMLSQGGDKNSIYSNPMNIVNTLKSASERYFPNLKKETYEMLMKYYLEQINIYNKYSNISNNYTYETLPPEYKFENTLVERNKNIEKRKSVAKVVQGDKEIISKADKGKDIVDRPYNP